MKTKLFKSLLLALIATMAPQLANAYDFMVDGLCYNFNDDGTSVTVTYERTTSPRYSNLSGALKIPSSVSYNGISYLVKSIDESSFWGCNQLTSATIPNSVTEIGSCAFYACYGLTSVILPDSLPVIDNYLFYRCYSLTSVYIPNSVTSIGANAFDHTGLGFIKIPESVNTIGYGAFFECHGLTSLIIPISVTSIFNDAFYECPVNTLTIYGQGSWNSSNLFGLKKIINNIRTVNIGSGITSLDDVGFTPSVVNCFSEIPPSCTSGTFSNYDGILHIPASSTLDYFTADIWQNFNNLMPDLTENITLNRLSANLIQWDFLQLIALISPPESEKDINWISSDSSVATVDKKGLVNAIGVGECDISCILHDLVAICHISVSYPEITLTLSDYFLGMNEGEQKTLVATIVPDNTGLTPTWSSSNTSVATVDENGKVTAMGEGECDVIASVLDKTATCHVSVGGNITLSLNIDKTILGANQLLTVYPTCTPDVPVELVVTSSDPSVAVARVVNRTNAPVQGLMSLTEKGMAFNMMEELAAPSESTDATLASEKAIMIVGVQNGTATITVSTSDGKATPAILELRVVDINDDRVVDIDDLNICINIILGINNDPVAAEHADLNGDGVVDVDDLNIIINIILNMY